jgi:hypothetical protein
MIRYATPVFLLIAACSIAVSSQTSRPSLPVDHLVYGTPDLGMGTNARQLLGLRATPGGQHRAEEPATHWSRLGPATYLEIIGPDPDQPTPRCRAVQCGRSEGTSLVTWAAKGKNLENLAGEAARRG